MWIHSSGVVGLDLLRYKFGRMNPPSILLVVMVLQAFTAAQEWTRFRGPAGQGIGKADDLPTKFTAANVRWRVDAGMGHSSPVLWKNKLFLTRMGEAGGAREIVCFDAEKGEELWATKCEFDAHRQHKFNSFASATPAIDEKGIYIVWSSGPKLVAEAFDHSGKRTWRRELGAFRAQHGSGASPVLHDDLMVIANENEGKESFLVALEKESGKQRWKIGRNTFPRRGAYSCPVVLTPKKGSPYILFTSTSHGLTAVDPKAGQVLWETDLDLNQRCVNTPAVSGDFVFFSGGSGGGGKESAFVRLPSKPGGKPKIVRRMRRAIPYVPCALALNGRFYLFTDGGVVRCLKAESGDEVWRERLDGSFFSSPVSNGKAIYIVGRDGTLFSIKSGKAFKLLGSFDLGAKAYATPAIARGVMYVRTFKELICLGAVSTEKRG